MANRSRGTKFTYVHFKAENIPRDTIYRTIKRAENESHSSVNGNDNFYTSNVNSNPALIKYRPTKKFGFLFLREVDIDLVKRLFETTRLRLSKIRIRGLPEDN